MIDEYLMAKYFTFNFLHSKKDSSNYKNIVLLCRMKKVQYLYKLNKLLQL